MKLTRMLECACLSWLLGRVIALMLWPSSARFACDHARALVLAPFLCRHSAWLLGAGESSSAGRVQSTLERKAAGQASNPLMACRLPGLQARMLNSQLYRDAGLSAMLRGGFAASAAQPAT